MNKIRLYWSRQLNFGDAFNTVLFRDIARIPFTWQHYKKADTFAIGSIAERIPSGFTGTVFGTGLMYHDSSVDLSAAKVMALRGPLTEARSGTKAEVLGDPGLLAGTLAPPMTRRITGVIPHFMDEDLAGKFGGKVIDIETGVQKVINAVAECEQVVTSCLHGLVLADSLGIPARWELCDAVWGNGFKFADYEMSIGIDPQPGVLRKADQGTISRIQHQLLGKLEELRQSL